MMVCVIAHATIIAMTDKTNTFHTLPTLDYRDQITDAVDQNQVVIITAETGAGKSTQVPQYLAEHGYDRVIVTQPRILAARNLAKRVREEWAERNTEDSSEIIGYRTAHERDDSGRTKILYCTDGLQLVRELTGTGINERQLLVLDEVHEWNENMEVLVAWAKKRCQEEPHFKVVIMSATIETRSLAEYFNTTAVIDVPGRYFEVTKRDGTDVLSELFAQLDAPGHSILTFLPGKAEIQDVADALKKKAAEVGVPVLPLHSQLDVETQQKAFASYPSGKIILATNIAQTSITIDDIDMVIDSGLERRSEVRNGVEGLFISQISQADCLQRAGRAGRTKPGEYILAPYDTMPCAPFDERDEYATPEIMRKHIDRLTLRLANVGIDIEMLDFYHDPSKSAIRRAKRTLVALGAMTPTGEVTRVGREMEQFPVESNYARMLVEVQQYDVPVQTILAAIIAIQEVGGIVKGGATYTGWKKLTRQRTSDLLAQYEVYLNLDQLLFEEYEDAGIIPKNIAKAEEVFARLCRDLSLDSELKPDISAEYETPLRRSIVAGQTDQLWTVLEKGRAEHIFTRQEREMSSSSVVRGASLVAGEPFDLQIPMYNGGLQTLHLLQGVTAVDTDWLIELLPDTFNGRRGKVVYDPRLGSLAERAQVRFGKRVLQGTSTPILEDSPQNRRLFAEEYAKWAYTKLESERRNLERFYRRVPVVPLRNVIQEVKARANGIVSLDQLNSRDKKAFTALASLETYLGEDFIYHLGKPRRDDEKLSKRHKGWKPKHKVKGNRNHRKDTW